jgi:hypothetical protein
MPLFTEISSLEEIPQFSVEKELVFDSRGNRIEKLFSLMRSDTRQHLGVCRDKYRPIQMDEMLDVIDQSCSKIGGINHVGYTVANNGKRVVIQSKLEESIKVNGDEIVGMFYTVIDNSGMNSNKIIPSTFRIACDNQLHLITRKDKGRRGMRHSFSFDEKVTSIIGRIRSNIETVKNFQTIVEDLRLQTFSEDDMRKLVSDLLPATAGKQDKLINKREDIVNRFSKGIGNIGKTKWDAINAITEYESHQKFTPEKLVRTLTMSTLSTKALNFLT